MNEKTPAQQILQRALDLLQDKDFCARNPNVMKGITEDIIDELQKRCDA